MRFNLDSTSNFSTSREKKTNFDLKSILVNMYKIAKALHMHVRGMQIVTLKHIVDVCYCYTTFVLNTIEYNRIQ